MKKLVAPTLEEAYTEASKAFGCSITELEIVVVQHPKKGFFGWMNRHAIIVAGIKATADSVEERIEVYESETPETVEEPPADTMFPEDEDGYEYDDVYEDETHFADLAADIDSIAAEVGTKINALFETLCFSLNEISVAAYDENTLLIEFNGEDAALLIGKEGYRYKALSYILFNWINAEYQLQLRLEIAEFLQNQEESVGRYLCGVCENVDRDGHAQTRVLDGVLVQIALKQLRERYHDKYVAIRTTRDGGKYIIINDYHSY